MATPATQLGERDDLKFPDLRIGQVVIPGNQWARDFPFYRKQYALHLIRAFRRLQPGIAGILGMRKTGGRLPEGNKTAIQECLRVFSEATNFEVAGIYVEHGYNLDSADFNACYLSGVPGAASPPGYAVQLLIRFNKDGKSLALITGCGVSAWNLKAVEE